MKAVNSCVSSYRSEVKECFAIRCPVFFKRLLLGRSWP